MSEGHTCRYGREVGGGGGEGGEKEVGRGGGKEGEGEGEREGMTGRGVKGNVKEVKVERVRERGKGQP